MNIFAGLMKLLSSDKKKKKKQAQQSQKAPKIPDNAEVPKSGSKKASRQTRKKKENHPPPASEDDPQTDEAASEEEEAQSGRSGDDTPDRDRDRTDEDRASRAGESLRSAPAVSIAENPDDKDRMEESKEKTPARTAREKEWCEWLAQRERESGARLQKALQDAVIQFAAQLEGAKRNMDGALADLRAQMLGMQWNMAAGILQRDERISKLEAQNSLLTGKRSHNAAGASARVEPSHHSSYDYSFAPVPPPFLLSRPSGPQYPMPDGSFPSYLQPPFDLDRGPPAFL
ncbi:uncharacterized protein LOC133497647 [Syngnathoides biaculeatus]|uniref:uncharacterized protein LOC133497647 n=1 Tax=Syngnathoides biaculeatus TaxID=300417 RepID=UPI002ADD666F|nr:uncharacterized protein LOC133497647 [Syngnathoides biaculeatus]